MNFLGNITIFYVVVNGNTAIDMLCHKHYKKILRVFSYFS